MIRPIAAAVAATLVFVHPALAQTAPAASDPAADASRSSSPPPPVAAVAGSASLEEDTLELSPFVVQADRDSGYVAQNTLAGSRLRTNLKDIAAAISPMTAEFLADIAATNIVEAMEYGINSRVETDDGRSAGPVADSYNDGTREIRVRGLPGAGRTLNYFRYFGEVDSYNTERVELSRGPNSILYGFGSPAGVINVGSKQARTDREVYSFSYRVDDWDGQRSTADVNLPLIKGKLGLRAVYLKGRDGSWRASGHNDQDRLYLSSTWDIDRKTRLRLDFENVVQNRFVPRPFHSVDQITVWMNAGQPGFTNFRADWANLAPNAAQTPGNPIRDSGTTAVTGVEEIGSNYVTVSPSFPYAMDYFRFTRSERNLAVNVPMNYGRFDLGLTNPRATLESNWVSALFKSRYYAATFQREIVRDLNLELSAAHQVYISRARNLSTWDRYGVTGDPNVYYPDGTLKPATNLYYFDVRPSLNYNDQQMDQLRGTLAYEKELGKFGRVRLAGLAEWSHNENRREILEPHWFNGPSVTSGGAYTADPLSSNNRSYWRYYLPDLAVLNDPNYAIPGPTDIGQVQVYNPATRTTRTIYGHYINRAQGNIDFWDEDLTSLMGVGQWFLLNNRIVATAGYRRDKLEHFETDAIRDPAGIAAGNPGIWLPVLPPSSPNAVLRGNTFTAGGVVYLTQRIIGFVNTSKSVNIPGDIRVFGADPVDSNPNTLAPLRDGKTLDYGLKFELFDGRVLATATRFSTQAHNDVGFSGFTARGDIVAIWNALKSAPRNLPGSLTAEESALANLMYEYTNRTQGYLLDSKTEGYEFELVGEVLPGWSVSLNYSLTESKRTNIASEVRRHIDQWKPLWLKYKTLSLSQTNAGAVLTNPHENFRTQAEADSTGDYTIDTNSINERIVDMENNFYNNPYVFEGSRFVGDNKHNLNLRTRYAFRHGTFKGLTVGAGMRMRYDRVAGAIPQYEYTSGSSFTDTWNGRVTTSRRLIKAVDSALYDLQLSYRMKLLKKKVDWTIQLNVDNVLDEDDLIVNNTHPRTGDPTTYRYQDPRRFILTNSFTF